LHPGSEARQRNYRRAQNGEYRQGCERFDHFGLLTVAGRQSLCAWGSNGNEAGDAEFRQMPLIYLTRPDNLDR
jgi:hypothetical protein